MERFRVAAVQAAPVFLDRRGTIEKAVQLIREAARGGAQVVVFPEAFIPCYPIWVWLLRPSDYDLVSSLHAELLSQSVCLESGDLDPLREVAREAGVIVGMGINERVSHASGSMYNAYVVIGEEGSILGIRRKLVPTAPERMVWTHADGSSLRAIPTKHAALGCLICWENYMPLARYALYADGSELILAPTWDEGEVWEASMRHIAKESRSYVVSCSSPLRREDIPEHHSFRSALGDGGEWFKSGGSLIADPTGAIVAGPLRDEEGILYADCDPALPSGQKWNLDVCGHYDRPDLFRLSVDRTPRSTLREESLDRRDE